MPFEHAGVVGEVGVSAGKALELGAEVEPSGVAGAVPELDRARVAAGEGVPHDAPQGGEASAGAGEDERLFGLTGDVEAFSGRAAYANGGTAGVFAREPMAHATGWKNADVELEEILIALAGAAGDGIRAREAVVANEGKELPRAMSERGCDAEVDAQHVFRKGRDVLDARSDFEILDRVERHFEIGRGHRLAREDEAARAQGVF